jgi:hypothetical protein
MNKSGPKRQTLKEPSNNHSYNKHLNWWQSRFFWKSARRIEKEEIRKEVDDKDK